MTANKTSNTKSNGSETSTLKKVIPSHMVKHVTRHASHESQPINQSSANSKIFQRIKTSNKVEKNNTVGNLAASNSGNKHSYLVQSGAARSSSHNNGNGQSTADTVKANESAQYRPNME